MNIQDTSREALESVRPLIKSMKEQVFEIIDAYAEGIIAEDIEAYLGNGRSTVTARIRGLVLDERVVDSGLRGVTKSGRAAIKWVAARPMALAA